MVIQRDLLISFGADLIKLKKNDLVFKQNDIPVYYFQIIKGKIKLATYQQGKEFIQSIHQEGQCIGQTFLFSKQSYHINAVAMEDSTIIRLDHLKFYQLLDADPYILWKLLQETSEKLHYSYIIKLTLDNPESKLLILFNYLRDNQNYSSSYSFEIPFTRKDIASLIGVRIETVIRAVKKMEKEKKLQIKKGKIFY